MLCQIVDAFSDILQWSNSHENERKCAANNGAWTSSLCLIWLSSQPGWGHTANLPPNITAQQPSKHSVGGSEASTWIFYLTRPTVWAAGRLPPFWLWGQGRRKGWRAAAASCSAGPRCHAAADGLDVQQCSPQPGGGEPGENQMKEWKQTVSAGPAGPHHITPFHFCLQKEFQQIFCFNRVTKNISKKKCFTEEKKMTRVKSINRIVLKVRLQLTN